MNAARGSWREKHRLVRQLNSLRKRFENRLPDRGFSLITHADLAAVMTVFKPVDPLKFSVGHRLRCAQGGVGYRLGDRSRLPA